MKKLGGFLQVPTLAGIAASAEVMRVELTQVVRKLENAYILASTGQRKQPSSTSSGLSDEQHPLVERGRTAPETSDCSCSFQKTTEVKFTTTDYQERAQAHSDSHLLNVTVVCAIFLVVVLWLTCFEEVSWKLKVAWIKKAQEPLLAGVHKSMLVNTSKAATSNNCVQYSSAEHGSAADINYRYSYNITEVPLYNGLRAVPGIEPLSAIDARSACGVLPFHEVPPVGAWHLATDESLVFEPSNCLLRRLSGDSARQCLSGKSIMWVGDSVTRYQYLALAYFLSHKHHIAKYQGTHLEEPSMVAEGEWHDRSGDPNRLWQRFFSGTTELLKSGEDAWVDTVCDCFRTDEAYANHFELIKEHRMMCLSTDSPLNAPCDKYWTPGPNQIKMGYYQAFHIPDNWYQAMITALHKVFDSGPPPDLIIFNCEFWIFGPPETSDEDIEFGYETLFSAAVAMKAAQGWHTKLVWKTIPKTTDERVEYKDRWDAINTIAIRVAQKYGFPIYDIYTPGEAALMQGVDSKLMNWDNRLHPFAYMYQEFNDLLLNALCDEQCHWKPQW